MPIRIYALAKELKIDSAELSQICAKAGITGKGSALASLTDEEDAKVRAFLAGGAHREPAKGAPAKGGPAQGIPSPSVSPPGAAGTGSTAQQIASQISGTGAVRREDYVAPSGSLGGKPRVLSPVSSKPPIEVVEKPAEPTAKQPKAAPTIKLAPLPSTQQPPAPAPTPEGPAPQKPDLKLPVEAIRAGKAGDARPLSEHLRKHEKKKQADAARGETAAPPMPVPPVEGRRERGRGKAKEVPADKEEGTLLGGREARQLSRKKAARTRRDQEGEEEAPARRRGQPRRRSGVSTAAPRKEKVIVQLPCSVRSLSEAIGVSAVAIQRQLMEMDTMATINTLLDHETVELLALEFEANIDIKQPVSLEDELTTSIMEAEDDPSQLAPRPPIVTFLGHVDHGKTSLLDAIIGIDVVSGERGGITQHIRAYNVKKDGRKISFVDTPGHEAFTEMRARGANVTDIAVLVVAADDGVMPQTEEAISHARAAEVPIVVALNKIDLPGIDENRIMQQLAANDLLPREWGGETELIRTSAVTQKGIDELLEMLLFIAEDQQFKANPQRAALGTCLEAQLHEGRGVVSKFIVQNGTLKVGDCIVCGQSYGRVKAMYNTLNPQKKLTKAGPSTPVDLTGLDVAPGAGERFLVVDDIAQARQIAEQREVSRRSASLAPPVHVTLEGLFDRLGQHKVQTLNLILRADVRGSIEAIRQELEKIQHPEVKFKILQATVGGITEADVHLADASDAIICGFNVVPDEQARVLADQKGVQIRRYDIIYNLTDDLKAALEGLLKPVQRETELGRALVQQVFKISRVGAVAGCRVLSGVIQRNGRARVIREQTVIGDYALDTLRRVKEDVREVREGLECGIKLAGYNDIKEGDILEVYKIEEVARTLDST
ncbi:MAG: translation initiation factor IF-2 [Planctomycetales bacterium]|nr:translation initiation factor IF-2 [Planctomycetales bacterium]NIM08618.1 translation initiation factor IF-2 [Planctomycetales bacterium]NIN08086.1 translation initiation factor IF-2 [Planctomycetales bacterium]NIN77220.1 translation initiation factor IF-2 [Planctomycetales bacterium]NIO34402.1 translation initiation factor IF-2 [Planctomycetales bacterium]